MRTIPSGEVGKELRELIDAARRSPVTVADEGGPAAVVMSIEDYERLRGEAWERLSATLARARRTAGNRGLTDELIESLLADES